jgi:AraC family transcriptional regulator
MTDRDSQTSRQRTLDRIGRVQEHIYANLDADLDLDTLADLAAMSRFHWHRIYRAVTGETVAQTVRRLRLARAASQLVTTHIPLARIATRAGYTSQAAFTRAFAAAYGKPPAEFRDTGEHADLVRASKENDPMAFPIEIRDLPVRPALGLVHAGAYNQIGRTFDKLFLALQADGLTSHVRGIFGRYVDDPEQVPADKLRSHACVFVDAAGLKTKSLEHLAAGGGSYAVLTYKGPYAAMQPAYDWLFGTWLPQSGRTARDEPVLEINLNTPLNAAQADLLTEICLPITD